MFMSEAVPSPGVQPATKAVVGSERLTAGATHENSEYETVRRNGYPWLRFPQAMEAHYLADTADERLKTLVLGGWAILVLIVVMAGIDCIMVPDQWALALTLRLLLLLPMKLLWIQKLPTMGIRAREWGLMGHMAVSASVLSVLVLSSQSTLAAPYLVALCMHILIIGSMLRAKFWNALWVNVFVLALFGVTWMLLPNPPTPVLISMTLTLLATAVFTLWGAYRLEYMHRAQWLMTHHEKHLQQSLQEGIRRLDELSRFDALTGLPNRREFANHLQKVWARAQRDGRPVAILLLDIDHFKAYNDTHGHMQGDECLKQVAMVLKHTVNTSKGLVARWGGEEFIVVLNDADTAQATQDAQRLVNAVRAMRLAHGASPTGPWVTCSVGVASVPAGTTHLSPEAVIAGADEALYRAKSGGRARCVAHDPHAPFPAVKAATLLEPEKAVASHGSSLRQIHLYKQEMLALMRPLSFLQFSGPLEGKYQQDTVDQRLKDFMRTGVLALIMFNLFLPVDYLLANDIWEKALWLRLAVFTPFWAMVALLLWQLHEHWVRHVPSWVHETTIAVSGICAAASLSYILASSHSPLVQYYHVGLMVVIVYSNLVQRLRFWFALGTTGIIYVMQVYGALVAPDIDPRLILPMIALVGASGAFSLMANYNIDRDERGNYLLSLRRKALLESLRDVHQQLLGLARVDPLTGQFNRRHANECLHEVWAHAQLDRQPLAVIMIDIDHFKPYNDHYGHLEGDKCLSQVAQALSACVRGPSDVVARYGGEEFVVILANTDEASASSVAERMRLAVQDLGLPHAESETAPQVTISMGVASVTRCKGFTADVLLQRADQALYRAKHLGRNRVVTYSLPVVPV